MSPREYARRATPEEKEELNWGHKKKVPTVKHDPDLESLVGKALAVISDPDEVFTMAYSGANAWKEAEVELDRLQNALRNSDPESSFPGRTKDTRKRDGKVHTYIRREKQM